MKLESEIRVLVVEPGEVPVVQMIPNTLAAKQQLVGGWIQVVDLDEKTVLVCNEEGKLLGLPLNRLVGDDFVVGTFLICGVDNETGEFISLSDKQAQHYMARFAVPEIIITAWQCPDHGQGKGASAWPRH